MKVLIFSTRSHYRDKSVGGAETSLRLIAEKFASIGESVVYVTAGSSRFPRIETKDISNVRIYFISVLSCPCLGSRRLSRLNSAFVAWQHRKWLAHLIKRENIQIIHTYNTYPNTHDILKIRERHNVDFKVIQRIAGMYWAEQVECKTVPGQMIEWVFNNVDTINFISPWLRDMFYARVEKLGLRVSAKKEVIMDIGIELDRFHVRPRPVENADFVIVCVARLSKRQKRQDLLIDALAKIKNSNIKMEFVGAGAMLNIYKEKVRKLGLEDKVTFHGFVKQTKVREILSRADVFALPTDYEGLSKAVLESMCVGIPVLLSDVAPLNAYVSEGVNGYLVANSPDEWANKIHDLYSDRKKLSKVVPLARKFVSTKYDSNRNIFKYREEFRRLIGSVTS